MSEPTPEAIETKVGRAREVILALDRAVRARRTHASDHVRALEATEDLIARFLDFFGVFDYLRVEIQPGEIRFERRALLKLEPREPNVPFLLFRDGLREIRFHRGISRDEVIEFLGIVEADPRAVREDGKDYVSLLWEHGFPSIDYVAVDEFDDADAPARLAPETAGEVEDLARRMDRLVRQILSKGCGSVAPAGSEGEDDAQPQPPGAEEAGLEALLSGGTEGGAARVRAAFDVDTTESLIGRAIDALRGLGGEVSSGDVERVIGGFAEQYARRDDFCGMGHLLVRLKTLAHEHPEAGRAVGKFAEVMGAADLQDRMVEFLNRRFGDDESGVRQFLEGLGPDGGPLLCKVLPRVASSRARRLLGEILISIGPGVAAPLRQLLVAGDALVPEVLELLHQIDPSALPDDLRGLLAHPSPAIRMQTIAMLGRMQGFARTKVLFGLLEDADVRIRRCVLKTLGEARDGGTVPFLKEWIGKADFHAREPEEKASAFRAVTTILGDAATAFLKQIVMTPAPRWGGASANDTRRSAVRALQDLGTARARETLEQIASEGDEVVRSLALSAGRM